MRGIFSGILTRIETVHYLGNHAQLFLYWANFLYPCLVWQPKLAFYRGRFKISGA